MLPIFHQTLAQALVVLGPTTVPGFPVPGTFLFQTIFLSVPLAATRQDVCPRAVFRLLSFSSEEGLRRLRR